MKPSSAKAKSYLRPLNKYSRVCQIWRENGKRDKRRS